MLWLDDDKGRSFEEKVRRAVEYYRNKYGRMPDRCYVNPRMLGAEMKVGPVLVQPADMVLPAHFWIGRESA